MVLEKVLKKYPEMKRLIIKGLDNRINLIYNKEEIPLDILPKQIYDAYLTNYGDLDVKMKL